MTSNFILLLVGLAGILSVNLIEIDAQNQKTDGNINLKQYCKKHWANLALSVVMVCASVIAKQFVAELEAAGKSLFVGIFAIGMVGPTVAQFIRSKALAFFKSKTAAADNS